jgi:hypothetical protein
MSKPKLNKTYNTFARNPELNRAFEVRRDTDNIKTPKCTIYDVDFAMMSYLRDIIKPQVIENNAVIDVPIMYANGEKWAQIQAKGFMYDEKGKIMTPLITLRRSTIAERDTLKTLGVNQNPDGNDYIYRNKFTITNQYDRFSVLQGTKPSQEYYVSPVPEFIDASYEMLIWCEYTEQLNSVVEQIMPLNGFAWGTTWKFPVMIQDYSFETINSAGEDRLVRATLPFTTKATLLMPYELRTSNFQKRFSVKKINFKSETESFNVNVSDPPPKTDEDPYSGGGLTRQFLE